MRAAWPLTLRGTGAVALAVACFVIAGQIGSVQLLAFGVFLLVLAAMGIAALHITHRDIVVERTPTPRIVAVGERTRVTVRVGMHTALPTTPGTWDDEMPTGVGGRTGGRFPGFGSGLRGGDRTVSLSYDAHGVHRGVHALGPLRIVVHDPFGIARRVRTVGDTTHITVTPAIVELPSLAGAAGGAGGSVHATTTRLGQGSDDLIARPYQAGDSMRRIHWRATAHVDALMVREEERESTPQAVVVLDRGVARWTRDAATRPGTDAAFESAVTACVSAVAALGRDGYAVHVVDVAGVPLADVVTDEAAATAVATRCATLVAQISARLGSATRLVSASPTGPVVLITGAMSDADVADLAALPAHSLHPVLLAAATTPDVLQHAADGGWFAASIAPGIDLRDAWERVRTDTVAGEGRRAAG